MAYETFRVVEINERFGFARLQAEVGGELFHSELYPEAGEERGPLQLRAGDRVSGLRRGQSVSRVSWLSRSPPPVEQVQQMAELRRILEGQGFLDLPAPEVLAERRWRKARD